MARLDDNIIFQKDGSIRLSFNKEMMKNEKAVNFVVNEGKRATHGILLDTLTLYYKKVYPFLYWKDSENISKHFFLAPNHGKVCPFNGEGQFGTSFKYYQREFLALDELNPADRDLLHAHFLRGRCADWLRGGLNMTPDQVGVYIGDDGKTVQKEYFDKEFVHDASDTIEQANIELKAHQQANQSQGDFSKTIQSLEKIIEDLRKQLARESKVQDSKVQDSNYEMVLHHHR